jgi:hypothetical protein
MTLLTRRRLVLVKEESVYGTDPTPIPQLNALLVRSIDVTPLNATMVQRENIQPYLGNYENLVALKNVELTLEVELAGSGNTSVAPAFAPLLRACGLQQNYYGAGGAVISDIANIDDITNDWDVPYNPGNYPARFEFTPQSENFGSCTIYINVDGIRHQISGCRGTVDLNFESGSIPTLSFQLIGSYQPPQDFALQEPVYYQPAPFPANSVSSAFSLYNFGAKLRSFTFNLGSEAVWRELIGEAYTMLVNRTPSASAVIEAERLNTKDFFAATLSNSYGNLVLTHGNTAGNTVILRSDRVDLTAGPTYSDDGGVTMLNLPLSFIPSVAGNDELKLIFQ